VAGDKMASVTGFPYCGTNESGFSGLPGGARYNNGIFNDIGTLVYWWSSVESSTTTAWSRMLYYGMVNCSGTLKTRRAVTVFGVSGIFSEHGDHLLSAAAFAAAKLKTGEKQCKKWCPRFSEIAMFQL